MTTNTVSSKVQMMEATETKMVTGSVVSKDGTTLGYRQIGKGPGLVLVHGAMETGLSHLQLAEALSNQFTVTMLDRRGRGLSGPFGKGYNVQKAVEDMDAVLTKTGAHYVFGVSAGGLICMYAALQLPAIHKVALFEPALSVNGAISMDFLKRYDQEMAEGKISAALVTGMIGAQMGPPIFSRLPRWLMEGMTSMMMNGEDKKAKAGDVTMRMLAPTLHYEFQLIDQADNTLKSFGAIKPPVLLLGGSDSPAYLKAALDGLEKIIPNVKERVEFPGVGHGASGNANQGGQPEKVAEVMRRFFA